MIDLILRMAVLVIQALRPLLRPFRSTILVLPPAGKGSLGDEAILQGLQNGIIEQHGDLKIRQVLLNIDRPLTLRGRALAPLKVVPWSRLSELAFITSLLRVRHVVVLGADVIDGKYDVNRPLFYLKLCNWALAANVPARVASFSFSENPEQAVIKAIGSADDRLRFFSRDPVSKERFERFTGRTAELTADLAFLLSPSKESEPYQSCARWVDERRSSGHILIGLNFNALTFVRPYEDSVASCRKFVESALSENPNIDMVMLPHDYRTNHSDLIVLQDVYKGLDDAFRERIYFVETTLHAWDVKGIVSLLDLVVTGRMHLAIAALGQLVPPICIAYMGKFEGLMQHFGVTGLIVEPKDAYGQGKLLDALRSAIHARNELRTALEQRLPEVKNLSARNVSDL